MPERSWPPGRTSLGWAGGKEGANASSARRAEGLVRAAGGGERLDWNGVELASHFQPIYCVRQAGCHGYEALVRAADANGGTIVPESLFSSLLGVQRARLDWACRALHLRNYAVVDPGDRTLFLNVHPEAAVHDARCEPGFGQLIRYYGLVPKRVCVEILEAPCTDEALLGEAIAAYRDMGASIAMDDFGVGRSNFDRVIALRPDIVKIDRSILASAVGQAKAGRMLPAIIGLLHQTGARVAIEGIETANEALIAIDAGADYLQGFYFAVPRKGLADEALSTGIIDKLVRLGGHSPHAPLAG